MKMLHPPVLSRPISYHNPNFNPNFNSHQQPSSSSRLFVGDIKNAEKGDLELAFSSFGTIKEIWMAHNPPGFAFVEFADRHYALAAVEKMNGVMVKGDKLRVEFSKGRKNGGLGRPPTPNMPAHNNGSISYAAPLPSHYHQHPEPPHPRNAPPPPLVPPLYSLQPPPPYRPPPHQSIYNGPPPRSSYSSTLGRSSLYKSSAHEVDNHIDKIQDSFSPHNRTLLPPPGYYAQPPHTPMPEPYQGHAIYRPPPSWSTIPANNSTPFYYKPYPPGTQSDHHHPLHFNADASIPPKSTSLADPHRQQKYEPFIDDRYKAGFLYERDRDRRDIQHRFYHETIPRDAPLPFLDPLEAAGHVGRSTSPHRAHYYMSPRRRSSPPIDMYYHRYYHNAEAGHIERYDCKLRRPYSPGYSSPPPREDYERYLRSLYPPPPPVVRSPSRSNSASPPYRSEYRRGPMATSPLAQKLKSNPRDARRPSPTSTNNRRGAEKGAAYAGSVDESASRNSRHHANYSAKSGREAHPSARR